jgi:hypothetical protein
MSLPFRGSFHAYLVRLALTRILRAVRFIAGQFAAVSSDPTVSEVLQTPDEGEFVQDVRNPGANGTAYDHVDGFGTSVTFSVDRDCPGRRPAIFQTKACALGDPRLLVRDHPYAAATVAAVECPR